MDMNAAGRGFTSLKLSGVANVSVVSSRVIRLTGAGRVAPAGRDLEKLNIVRRPSGLWTGSWVGESSILDPEED